MEVHRSLGPGFFESIYRNALLHELHLRGLQTSCEVEVPILYKDVLLGKHRLDLFVSGQIVVELKAVAGINPVHLAQTLSYLRAVNAEVGLVINFSGTSLFWKRILNKIR
jgi:GxxExxY protein